MTNSSSLLNILFKHDSPFKKGGNGTYKIVVTNYGNESTQNPVTVAFTLPNGLKFNSFSGNGWNFNNNSLSFTQNNILKPGVSFPTLTFNVDVDLNAPYTLIPSVTISGGGSISSTVTNLTTAR